MNLHDRRRQDAAEKTEMCHCTLNVPAAGCHMPKFTTNLESLKKGKKKKKKKACCELDGQETVSPLSAMFSLRFSSSGSNFGLKRRRKKNQKHPEMKRKKRTYINPVMKR